MIEPAERDEDRVVIRSSGRDFFGWTSVQVDMGIEMAARTFAVAVAGVYATEAGFLVEGDEAIISVGEDRVVTGWIEHVEHAGDAQGASVNLAGRSKTCDIVDCSAPLGSWRNQKLSKLVAIFLDPYQLEWVDEAGVGDDLVRAHRTEEGESIHDAFDRLSRDIGFLVTDDVYGRVVFTRAGAGGSASDKIIRGTAGFLSGNVSRSMAERYSSYLVKGQSFTDLEVDVNAQGGAEDTGVTRFRQLIVKPERGVSKAAALKRAKWEATTRAAKALEASYTQEGWRQADGAIWLPNQTIEVVDGFARLFGVDLLAVSLGFSLDNEQGRVTSFNLAPSEGFTPAPGRGVDVSAYAYEEAPTTAPESALDEDDEGGFE